MVLIVIGPVTQDLIIIKNKKESKTGGAVYFQSFVFEKFYDDYLIITNCSDTRLIKDFPDKSKVKLIEKDETHYFINDYPNNDDFRIQSSNFANIPITKKDLENVLPENIDAFIINPLNAFDFPKETIDYIKSFNVPIYMSLQGFLRYPNEKIGENYSIKLKLTSDVRDITCGIDGLFMDESEALILFENSGYEDFIIDEIIITDGSKGSKVISDDEYKIKAVKNENIVDTTGCGDTYMAAYISQRLQSKSIKQSGEFASKIASEKINKMGHY